MLFKRVEKKPEAELAAISLDKLDQLQVTFVQRTAERLYQICQNHSNRLFKEVSISFESRPRETAPLRETKIKRLKAKTPNTTINKELDKKLDEFEAMAEESALDEILANIKAEFGVEGVALFRRFYTAKKNNQVDSFLREIYPEWDEAEMGSCRGGIRISST